MNEREFYAELTELQKNGWTALVQARRAPHNYIRSTFYLRYVELTAPTATQLKVFASCDPIVAMVFAKVGLFLLQSDASLGIHEWRDVESAASLLPLNWAFVREVWKASYDRVDHNAAVRTQLLEALGLTDIEIDCKTGKHLAVA